MEVFKILKFHLPISLYESYQQSRRSYLTHYQLLPPEPSGDFIYRSSVIWNKIRQKLNITDLSENISNIKIRLKKLLLTNQHQHDKIEWHPSYDFNIS